MRKTCALQKGVVLFVISLTLMSKSFAQHKPDQVGQAEIDARIERVENGLLAPTKLQGEPPVRLRLADRMKLYKTPGVSIAVINNGRLEWARGFGVLEVGGQEKVNDETLFQAGSISKSITALGTLRLVEKKKLNLDEDINKQLISWKLPENEFTATQKPTLRRVLTHNAGITVSGFLGYPVNEPLPTLLQILDGQKPANSTPIRVDSLPGAGFKYSGGGYMIIQQLLADVTKQPFEEFMQQTVLKKLGMTHSTFQQPLPQKLATTSAAGHLPDGKEMEGRGFVLAELAAGGLWSTPADLARFVLELQESRVGKSNKVISMAMTKEMLTPQIENIALGLMVDGKGPSERFTFSGSNVGFKSRFVGYMNSGQGAVVMANSESSAELIIEILRSIAAEYGWPDYRPRERVIVKVDPKIYDDYVGEYEIMPGFILTVSREGDKLMSRAMPVPTPPSAVGQSWSEMFPESDVEFFVKDADASFKFIRDDKGQVIQVNIQRTTRMFQAKRINAPRQ
jgi:CubicO group peptidase (beta-lactamase class C family)